MAFALVVRIGAEKDALVQTVSNMMIHLPGGSKEYSALNQHNLKVIEILHLNKRHFIQ